MFNKHSNYPEAVMQTPAQSECLEICCDKFCPDQIAFAPNTNKQTFPQLLNNGKPVYMLTLMTDPMASLLNIYCCFSAVGH